MTKPYLRKPLRARNGERFRLITISRHERRSHAPKPHQNYRRRNCGRHRGLVFGPNK